MIRSQAYTTESLVNDWNETFPHYTLKPDDLKKPHSLMEALFQIFHRLGIDTDFVRAPPDDPGNESLVYYWDLVPVINTAQVVNHLVGNMPQVGATISLMHLLQPTIPSSHSILLLLYNLMLFKESRMDAIAKDEEALFAKTEQIKSLEDRKIKLLEMLNKQAEEKGLRAQRLDTLRSDVKQFEEEFKQEKEVHNEEKVEQEPILKENHQMKLLLEQKKTQRDALLAEVARKKALRVYDADDIKAQAEQAAQNVQEEDEKLNTLRTTLMQKENSLKNLHTIKPSLDTANALLRDIMKLTDSLKDSESGDLDTDSKEGELDVLDTELAELRVTLSELQAAREEAHCRRQESQAKQQSKTAQVQSALREAEEKDKKCRERNRKAAQRIDDIKQMTLNYEQEKATGMEELAEIKNTFCNNIKSAEDLLIKKLSEVEKTVADKLKSRKM